MIKIDNSTLILTPITSDEIERLNNIPFGNESLYVLYTLPNSNMINIGNMGTTLNEYFPELANISKLDQAINKAFFYNGDTLLAQTATKVIDRPVYAIFKSRNSTVLKYVMLNKNECELSLSLKDIIDGKLKINSENKKTIK